MPSILASAGDSQWSEDFCSVERVLVELSTFAMHSHIVLPGYSFFQSENAKNTQRGRVKRGIILLLIGAHAHLEEQCSGSRRSPQVLWNAHFCDFSCQVL